MKNSIRILALVAAATLVSLSQAALAQSRCNAVRVNIPFAFQYGSAHLPAGTYTLTVESPDVTMLRGVNKSALAIIITENNNTPVSQGRVLFDHVGSLYFLRNIWLPGSASVLSLHVSRAQTRAERELASRDEKSTQVAILALPAGQGTPGL